MKDKVVISTISPCYHMERYLPTFLAWLPKQTIFDHLEVVLDHNEPTNSEISLVKGFQKKYPHRIRHIIHSKVDPLGLSMNRCLKEATGDYVAIWNVDDLRTPSSLESQINLLSQNSQIGVVYGDFIIVSQFGSITGNEINIPNTAHDEYTRSMMLGPFFCFRKSLVKTVGYFDEQLKSGADFDLALRLAFNSQVGRTRSLLGYYLNEGKGASTRPNSLQPIERTVIELRYGIYDKLDYDYLPLTNTYDISNIYQFGERYPVSMYVPHYDELLSLRQRQWLIQGLKNHVARSTWQYKTKQWIVKKYYGYKYLLSHL